MLSWPPTVRIFVCSHATDMRKGFDSLAHWSAPQDLVHLK